MRQHNSRADPRADHRYLYRPSRYRAPEWLHRLWAWL